MSIVLMYHGLFRDEKDLQRIDPEDRPYAVSVNEFSRQLAELNRYSTGLLQSNASDSPEVIVTFDDGHVSSYDRALPLLQELGIKACFFVTSDFVDQRKNFCTGSQLRELADAGMVIGAHGQTHRFFAELDNAEAVRELKTSRSFLQDVSGHCVDTLSFPGGRYKPDNIEQAIDCGFREIYGSGFGAVEFRGGNFVAPINRIPLKQTTSIDSFKQIVAGDRQYYACEGIKSSCKTLLKRLLGNHGYHALYKFAAERN